MKKEGNWTTFWDMHSGGDQKLEWRLIFIEAPKKEAEGVFYSRFKRNPHRVTCTCCGEDYSVNDNDTTLEEATAFHRNCMWTEKQGGHYIEEPNEYGDYVSLDEFLKRKEIKVIFAKDIKAQEKNVILPEEGYAWIN